MNTQLMQIELQPGFMRNFSNWLIAVLLMVGFAITGSANADPAEERPTIGQPAKCGPFEIFIGTLDYTKVIAGEFANSEATDGAKFMVVNWTYTNVSKAPIGAMASPKIYLISKDGTKYSEDVGASVNYATSNPGSEKIVSKINPGIVSKTSTVFEISNELYDPFEWSILVECEATRTLFSIRQLENPPSPLESDRIAVGTLAKFGEISAGIQSINFKKAYGSLLSVYVQSEEGSIFVEVNWEIENHSSESVNPFSNDKSENVEVCLVPEDGRKFVVHRVASAISFFESGVPYQKSDPIPAGKKLNRRDVFEIPEKLYNPEKWAAVIRMGKEKKWFSLNSSSGSTKVGDLSSAPILALLPYNPNFVELMKNLEELGELRNKVVEWAIAVQDVSKTDVDYVVIGKEFDNEVPAIIHLTPRNDTERSQIESLKKGEIIRFLGGLNGIVKMKSRNNSLNIDPAILVSGNGPLPGEMEIIKSLDESSVTNNCSYASFVDKFQDESDQTELQRNIFLAKLMGEIVEWEIPLENKDFKSLTTAFRMYIYRKVGITVCLIPRNDGDRLKCRSLGSNDKVRVRGKLIKGIQSNSYMLECVMLDSSEKKVTFLNEARDRTSKTKPTKNHDEGNASVEFGRQKGTRTETFLSDGDKLDAIVVSKWSLARIRFEINTIYARRGVEFRDKKIQEWADQQPWYHRVSGRDYSTAEDLFNETERNNIELLGKARALKDR